MRQGLKSEEHLIPLWDGKFLVHDEFSKLRSVLIHSPTNAIDLTMEIITSVVPMDELADHPETGSVSKSLLMEQHARLYELIDAFGVTIESPTKQDGAFCQVFTRDPCFIIGDRLFLGTLRDDYRHTEMDGLTNIRNRSATTALIWPMATLEGGDVFVLREAEIVLVGTNRHTNVGGINWLEKQLEPIGTKVVPVPHHALHLDCCLAPLPNGEALFTPGKIPETSLQMLSPFFTKLRPLDKDEGWQHLAANIFWLDTENVVSNIATPATNQLLQSLGYNVHELHFSELVAMWGSVRCVTCPLQRG